MLERHEAGLALSIIVVTWNSSRVIGGLLDSLGDAGLPQSCELIIVDNASSDDTVAIVKTKRPDARVVANGRNVGLAAANNQGLAASRGCFILISNPDVVYRPGSIRALMDTMSRRPSAAWVVPRLLYEDGSLHTSAGDIPTFIEALLGRQAARRRASSATSGCWWDDWAHDEERQIGRGHEAAYLVRRRAVEEVGLQDPRYVLDWEGLDWTERFRRTGWEIWISPEAEAVHLGGASVRQVPYRWVTSHHLGMYLYFADRSNALLKPVLAAVVAVRAVLKMALMTAGVPMYRWAHRDRRSDVRP